MNTTFFPVNPQISFQVEKKGVGFIDKLRIHICSGEVIITGINEEEGVKQLGEIVVDETSFENGMIGWLKTRGWIVGRPIPRQVRVFSLVVDNDQGLSTQLFTTREEALRCLYQSLGGTDGNASPEEMNTFIRAYYDADQDGGRAEIEEHL